jgi:hypothetical protein
MTDMPTKTEKAKPLFPKWRRKTGPLTAKLRARMKRQNGYWTAVERWIVWYGEFWAFMHQLHQNALDLVLDAKTALTIAREAREYRGAGHRKAAVDWLNETIATLTELRNALAADLRVPKVVNNAEPPQLPAAQATAGQARDL